MRTVLKVGKKGVVVLPKELRERMGLSAGDILIAEIKGDSVALRLLWPREADVDLQLVYELLEEKMLEEKRLRRLIRAR